VHNNFVNINVVTTHGSAYVMQGHGFQSLYVHGVRAITSKKAPDGERISLTFRLTQRTAVSQQWVPHTSTIAVLEKPNAYSASFDALMTEIGSLLDEDITFCYNKRSTNNGDFPPPPHALIDN